MDANQPPVSGGPYDGHPGSVVPAAPVESASWAPPAPSAYEAAPGSFSFQTPEYPAPSEPFDFPPPSAAPAYELSAPEPVYAVPPVLEPAYAPPVEAAPSYTLTEAVPAVPAATLPAYTLTEAVPFGMGSQEVTVEVPEQASGDVDKDAYESQVRLGAEDTSTDSTLLTDLLIETLDRSCSDLHLTVGAPPTVRQHGHLTPMEERAKLTPQSLQKLLYAIMSQKQREKFEAELELDFAYSVPGRARFRVNVYRQRDSVGAAFRLIPYEIKPLEALGVPPSVSNFAMLPRGFVLVTGPTGSGKSTTLAAIVDLANRQRRDHIMTVEDPIEFLHEHKSCLVNQREVGEDTHNFKNALKHVLRQDPDIILVGEMRDLETIEIALTAAETGHLVMATLHTQDAAQTIDRVIDVFPPHQQQQVRVQLASALQGVVCQQLVRTVDGLGRVVATEVLIATPAIRNLIREGKTHQIYSAMQAGAKFGMATMDQHLAELVKKGKVAYDVALEKCHHVEDFNRLCGR
ncbi:MAG TPA: PilT/PilU family type 4a pilus ATPase [Mycobacteriales bacterium]|nr:PilT/PilU family type 4a pilus ATPase [Mycobacteriales bacterium]